MTETYATRWMHYCPPCRERSKPRTPICDSILTRTDVNAAIPPLAAEINHKPSSMPLAASLQESFVRVDPQTINWPAVKSVYSPHADADWTYIPKDDPPSYSDIADYEFVNCVDTSVEEKPIAKKGVSGSSKWKKESRARWFRFFQKH